MHADYIPTTHVATYYEHSLGRFLARHDVTDRNKELVATCFSITFPYGDQLSLPRQINLSAGSRSTLRIFGSRRRRRATATSVPGSTSTVVTPIQKSLHGLTRSIPALDILLTHALSGYIVIPCDFKTLAASSRVPEIVIPITPGTNGRSGFWNC